MTETAGIFFIDKFNKLLVAHPTGHDFDFWSIPKGKLDEGETAFIAAVRETYEETNVNLFDHFGSLTYTELEPIKYKNKRKLLVPFIMFEEDNPTVNSSEFSFKCNSIIPEDRKWNAGLPEMDGWRWVTIKEAKKILHPTQVEVLKYITEQIKKRNGKKKG